MEQRDPKGSQHYSLYAGRRALHKAQESCAARIYILDHGNASDVAHKSKIEALAKSIALALCWVAFCK